MLTKLVDRIFTAVVSIQSNLWLSFKIVAVLGIIHLINFVVKYRFNRWGIRPRKLIGIPGIFLSPLFHGGFNHLFFNAIPLIILTALVLVDVDGVTNFSKITFWLILVSGALIWLFGRRGIHIGASALIMGYFGYLLSKAYFDFNNTTIILAAICIYYLGGLITSIFPGAKRNVSWEGHLCGMIAGIGIAYIHTYLI